MQISISVSVFCCFLPPSESYPTIYLWKAMCPCTWLNRIGGHSLPWPPSRMYDTMWHSMEFLCVDFHSEKWVSELPYSALNRIYLRDYLFKRCNIKSINANIKSPKIDNIDLWLAVFSISLMTVFLEKKGVKCPSK